MGNCVGRMYKLKTAGDVSTGGLFILNSLHVRTGNWNEQITRSKNEDVRDEPDFSLQRDAQYLAPVLRSC